MTTARRDDSDLHVPSCSPMFLSEEHIVATERWFGLHPEIITSSIALNCGLPGYYSSPVLTAHLKKKNAHTG